MNSELETASRALTLHKEIEDGKRREERSSRRFKESRKEVDLFAEARKVIGLTSAEH